MVSRAEGSASLRRHLLSHVVILTADLSNHAESGLRDRFDPAVMRNVVIIVLSHLRTNGPTRPRALREQLRFTSGGTSNLLGRLEAAGLIRRTSTAVDDDDRAVLVELTPLGEQTEAAVVAELLKGMRQSAAVLKELLVTFEHLGTTVAGRPRRRRGASGTVLVRALADVGEALITALDTVRSDYSASMVLIAIGDIGPCRPRYLADRLMISTPGVAKLLNRLEGEGTIRREAGTHPEDRRAILVHLTDEGVIALDHILANVEQHLDQLAESVTAVSRALGVALAK